MRRIIRSCTKNKIPYFTRLEVFIKILLYTLYQEQLSGCVASTKLRVAETRAGRYLGILVIRWYSNQMICVSSKFQRHSIITFGIIVVLPCLEIFQG